MATVSLRSSASPHPTQPFKKSERRAARPRKPPAAPPAPRPSPRCILLNASPKRRSTWMRTGRSAWACCNSARISSKPRARRAARRRTLERSAPSTEPAAASSRAGSASVEARSGAWARSSGERGSASMSSAAYLAASRATA